MRSPYENGRDHLELSPLLRRQFEGSIEHVAVEDAEAIGAEVDTAVNAGVAGDALDGGEFVGVVGDSIPAFAHVVGTVNFVGAIHHAGNEDGRVVGIGGCLAKPECGAEFHIGYFGETVSAISGIPQPVQIRGTGTTGQRSVDSPGRGAVAAILARGRPKGL